MIGPIERLYQPPTSRTLAVGSRRSRILTTFISSMSAGSAPSTICSSPMLRAVPHRVSVTIAAEHTGVGAAETYAFSLAASLASRGRDVELLVSEEIRARAVAWVAATDARVTVVPAAVVPRFLACLRRFAQHRPAVVHVNHAVSAVLIAALAAGVPARFVTDHVLPLRPSYNKRGELLRRLTRVSATDVVVFSKQNAALASDSWGGRTVHPIAAGVPQALCSREFAEPAESWACQRERRS